MIRAGFFYLTKNKLLRYSRMDINEYIVQDPSINGGKPIFKGTRLTIELVLDRLSDGWTVEDILNSYPQLDKNKLNKLIRISNKSMISI